MVFSSKEFMKLVAAYGLETEYITPYNPEQNGVVERFMRTLKEECIWLQGFDSFSEAKGLSKTGSESTTPSAPTRNSATSPQSSTNRN